MIYTRTETWLTPQEVADRLGMNRETIYRWIKAGKIDCERVGPRGWLIPSSAVKVIEEPR